MVGVSVEDSAKREYLADSKNLFDKQIEKNVDKIIEYNENEHTHNIHGPGRLDGVATSHDDRLLVLEGMVRILLDRIIELQDGP